MPMDACPLFVLPDHAPNAQNGKISPFSDMRVLQEVMVRFKAIQVDPAEFACLKAIVLFKPGKNNPTSYQCSVNVLCGCIDHLRHA